MDRQNRETPPGKFKKQNDRHPLRGGSDLGADDELHIHTRRGHDDSDEEAADHGPDARLADATEKVYIYCAGKCDGGPTR